MRSVALLSDVHANVAALRAVQQDLPSGIPVWFLGDFTGRGPELLRTLARLWDVYEKQTGEDRACWIIGNHDDVVIENVPVGTIVAENNPLMDISGHQGAAAQMDDEHRTMLNDPAYPERRLWRDWLRKLKRHEHPAKHLYLAHGLYLIENGVVDEAVARLGKGDAVQFGRMFRNLCDHAPDKPRLMLVGHTHVSGVWQWQPESETMLEVYRKGSGIQHYTGLDRQPVVINPGSIGFPRHEDTCPTWALLSYAPDFSEITVELRVVRYNPNNNSVKLPPGYPKQFKDEIFRCQNHDG